MVWRPTEGQVLLDASFLLEAPAGKNGFLRAENGHIVRPDGSRFRIWGVNFSFVASLPAKEEAPAVAAHLARFGVNCVRVHHHDWRVPRGLIDSKFPDSQHFDADRLDRLDFFISELKKRGIYTDLNLNVARAFQAGDGVKDADKLGFGKTVTLYDNRIIELEQDFARQYLTHRNPYTGNEYRNEPAIAIVEIVNENSIIESWVRGRLLGKGPDPKQTDLTWSDIPASYEKNLTAMYQKWLGAPTPRLRPDEFKAADPARFRKEAAFYMELEDRFYQRMQTYLKKDLGVQSLVVGTSIHNGGLSPYPLLNSLAKLDVVDAHTYWQHPRYGVDAATGRRTFEIENTPMVDRPWRSTINTLGRVAVAGKPFIITEVNHPYPNEYAAEMMPIAAAYGNFQDWDGIFWYSFEHNDASNWNSHFPSHFDIRQDPVKMTQLAATAILFQRGDIAPARQTIVRTYSRNQVADSLKLPSGEGPLFTPGMSASTAMRHAIRVGSLDGPPTAVPPSESGPLVSDTGELKWLVEDNRDGLVAISSARSAGLVGHIAPGAQAGPLQASIENPFAAILLVSLDGKPLTESSRLLLTTGARTANTGMKWNDAHTTLVETGTGPMMIEPVRGRITLRGFPKLSVQPLDGAGRALGSKSTISGGNIPLGKTVTPWYLIEVAR